MRLFGTLRPPDTVIKELNTIMFKFIWNKVEKVKRKIMSQDFQLGGLRVPDLRIIYQTFLVKWVKRILNPEVNSSTMLIPRVLFNNFAPDLMVLKCNTTYQTLCNNFAVNTLPPFYQDMIKTWYQCKQEQQQVETQHVLWLNDRIQYKGKPLFFRGWFNNSIIYVADMLGQHNSVLSFVETVRRLGKSADVLLKYNVVYNALNNSTIHDTVGSEVLPVISVSSAAKFMNKNIKSLFTDKENRVVVKQLFWERILHCTLDSWENVWLLPHRVKCDSKCKEIQWKILHNVYPTRVSLYKLGIVETNLCLSCNSLDYIEHFFVYCSSVKPLWQVIELKASAFYGYSIKLSDSDIMLGYNVHEAVKFKILNRIILLAKVCISKFRWFGKHPNLVLLFERECSYRNLTM